MYSERRERNATRVLSRGILYAAMVDDKEQKDAVRDISYIIISNN